MNNIDWMVVLVVALCFYLLGLLSGSISKSSDIEESCLYDNRLVFSTDKVFECTYLEGVRVK